MKVISCNIKCKAKNECMSLKQSIKIVNESDQPKELSLPILFVTFLDPKSITVKYKNQTQKANITELSDPEIIKFDDEVSSNNLAIRVNKDECSISIEMSNFPPHSTIEIAVQMSSEYLDDLFNLYFVIPPIEKYDINLYPNYNISIQILTEKIKLKDIKFEYNGMDHTKDIYDKENINANDVSFQSSLILKMPLKKIEEQHFSSLLKASDIIIFIDNRFCSSPTLSSAVINFLNNYGINYRFSIIKYGSNSCALFNKMVEKNQETIDEVENFFKVGSSTDLYCDFIDAYTNIFGLGYNGPKLKSEQNRIIYQALKVEEIDENNTIAICFGTFNSDKIITTKKVPTFLIDPILKYNTVNFARRNNFEFVGPFIHNKNEIEYAFNRLMQKIRTYKSETRYQYFEEEPLYQENSENNQVKQNQSENDFNFKIYLKELEPPPPCVANPILTTSFSDYASDKTQENLSECNFEPQIHDAIDTTENQYNNNNNNNYDDKSADGDDSKCFCNMAGKMIDSVPIQNNYSFVSFPLDYISSKDPTYTTPLNVNTIFSDECLLSCIKYMFDDDNLQNSIEDMKKKENEKIESAFHDQDSSHIIFNNFQENDTKLKKESKKNDNKKESKKDEKENKKNDFKDETKNNNNKSRNNNLIKPAIFHVPQIDKMNHCFSSDSDSDCYDDYNNNSSFKREEFNLDDRPEIHTEFVKNDLSFRV